MTQKEKRILIISGIINIIGLIWAIIAWMINGNEIYDTLQQFLFSTCFFQFIAVALYIFRKKVKNRAARTVMLIGMLHILFCFALELIVYAVQFVQSIV